MQCLDDRETQMEEDTIFVRRGRTGLQVGNNRTVIMFNFEHQSPAASPPPITHTNSCPATSNAYVK